MYDAISAQFEIVTAVFYIYRMKHWLILPFFLVYTLIGIGQVDSLEQALASAEGEDRLLILEQLAQSSANNQVALKWATELFEAAETRADFYYMAMAHHYRGVALEAEGSVPESIMEHKSAIEKFRMIDRMDKAARQMVNLGNRYADIGLYDSALASYGRGEIAARSVKDTMALYGAILNISTIHHDRGDREKELDYLTRAQTLVEGIGDPDQLALMKYNIAVFYAEDGQTEKSLELAQESFETYKATNNLFGQASVHTLWAEFLFKENKEDSALKELDQAIKLYEATGDVNRVALILMNQGAVLAKMGRLKDGLRKNNLAYEIFKEIGDQRFVAKTLMAKSEFLSKDGDNDGAIELAEEAIEIGEEIWIRKDLINWTKILSDLYVEAGKYEKAYQTLERHGALKDSLNEENKSKAIAEMEARFQTQKKQLEIDGLKREKNLQEIELDHEHKQRIWVTIGLVLTVIMVIIIGIALMQKRRDNQLIRAQKAEVESQNAEIAHQRLILQEKNREITDSITYAKRIQEAILPEHAFWKSELKNSFVLYKPKDIVAGDFYWMEKLRDRVLFAAADCTGHGVPGAMVSVVCHNALNRAVREYGKVQPAHILDTVRELVVETFESQLKDDSDTIKDGMDIAICSLNTSTREVTFAGAHNPLWIVSKFEHDLIKREQKEDWNLFEIKADKQPVGAFEQSTPYSESVIQLQAGDTIYMFSDGYSDQFGGERGKKFKQASMRALILELQTISIERQATVLWERMESWRGDLEQVDDICVIGVQV